MAKIRIYPHRTADPGEVDWGAWWVQRDDQRLPLGPLLQHWDYAREETVGRTVTVDMDAVLRTAGLENAADLDLLILVDCPATQNRFVGKQTLRGSSKESVFDVSVTLPPGELAAEVELSSHLVLARTLRPNAERVAYAQGSRLLSSESFRVRLEGDAGRFPTELVSFSRLNYAQAPWTVLAAFDDLNDSFMSCVRLLINIDHRAGELAADPAAAARIGGFLRMDILRLLIAHVAAQHEMAAEDEYDEGTVGRVLDSMCRFLLDRSLGSALNMYKTDPVHFERYLHSRVDPWAEAV